MAFQRQIYSADYYTGANVSISIGPCLLSQAYGIQYSVTQNKFPIFGYNSQYFDAVAKGIVQVQGMLYLNYISPRYLTVTIHRFYQTMYAWLQAVNSSDPESLATYLRETPEAMNLFRAMTNRLDIPLNMIPFDEGEYYLPGGEEPFAYEIGIAGEEDSAVKVEAAFSGASSEAPDFSVLLSDFFANDAAVSGLTALLWGDNASFIDDNGLSDGFIRAGVADGRVLNQWSLSDIASRAQQPLDMLSSMARPDQFGSAVDGIHGVDITINYGNPYDSQITNATFQYDHSSSVVLRGVHFTGESQAIYANGEPILDVYTFIAREKHSVPRRTSFTSAVNET